MLRKPLAVAGVVFACAATGVFIAVAIQAWKVKAEVDRQTAYLADQGNKAGDAADHAIGFVKDVIDQARDELKKARVTASVPAPARVNPFVQATARQASINLAGSVERALGAVVTASDAVTVVNAALDVVSNPKQYPELERWFGVDSAQVQETQGKLKSVSEELRQAKTILGVPFGSDAADPTPEQLAAVGDALNMAEQFQQEMTKVVATARKRVNAMKDLVDLWAWRLAVGTSVLCAVSVVGQFFLARYCLRKLYNLPA